MPEAWQDNWQPVPIAMPLPDAEVVTGWWLTPLCNSSLAHLLLMLSPVLRQCVPVGYCVLRSERPWL